jgi:hypothetical protein
MPTITVTGGLGGTPVTLNYAAKDLAYSEAYKLALQVDDTYSNVAAVVYNPSNPYMSGHGGYSIVPDSLSGSGNFIDVRGFGAVTIDNNSGIDDVLGGGRNTNQIVLAADGGLDFRATAGNVTVVAGGGNNLISFNANGGIGNTLNTGINAVYTGDGNDTIWGGAGQTTIAAGGGTNTIYLGAGTTDIISQGMDAIRLGTGTDTINVQTGGSDYIHGGSYAGTGFSLVFHGDTTAGSLSSTVNGGGGRYDINVGAGGGYYRGGSDGGNLIVDSISGHSLIVGGGAGDTLMGMTGDAIRASVGNETLGGAASANTGILYQFYDNKNAQYGYTNVTDHIINFSSTDVIKLIGPDAGAAITLALSTYTVAGGSASFSLEDGTKIVLNGYTGSASTVHFV